LFGGRKEETWHTVFPRGVYELEGGDLDWRRRNWHQIARKRKRGNGGSGTGTSLLAKCGKRAARLSESES